jgi:hypothetical protein
MSNKEFQEPEEKDMNDDFVFDDFDPLGEPVLEKEYTKHNVKVDAKDFANDIPEPSFIPPPMGGQMSADEKVKKPQEQPFNPKMDSLPKKDKHDASEKVADMILSAYKFGKGWADTQLLFNQKQLNKMQEKGEIDLDVEIQISPSVSMTAGEFIEDYNEQSKGTLVVTEEFVTEFKPVLVRVLEKKGVGMTDEQLLWYLAGKELLVTGFMFNQGYNVKKEILKTLKEAVQVTKMQNVAPQPIAQPTYQAPPQQPKQQTYSKPFNPDTNVNDFVNQMSGGIVDEPMYEEEIVAHENTEPTPKITIISEGTKKPISSGKRGRPKKK